MSNFWEELKRRHIFRVATVYGITSWLIVEIASVIFDAFNIPNWALRLLIILAILGFPIALIFAWAFEVSPKGIVRVTPDSDSNPYPASKRKPLTGFVTIGILIALLIGQFVYFNYWSTGTGDQGNKKLKSIAVLPFRPIGNDPDGQYFADGVQEELLNHLSFIGDLEVKSRTSVEKYRERVPTQEELLEDLKITHYIEGSTRKLGNQIRITVQLIELESNSHIWAKNFDRVYDKIWETQSEIAKAVAKELKAKITDKEEKKIEKLPTENPLAWDNYLKGKFYWRYQKSAEGEALAKRHLKKAVEIDPAFAQAYSLLSEVYNRHAMSGYKEDVDSTLYFADQAIRLNSEAAEPYIQKAIYYAYNGDDRSKATVLFNKAISLEPENPKALEEYGAFQYLVNWDLKSALKLSFRAIDIGLDQYELAERLGIIGHIYTDLMDFEKAEEYCRAAIECSEDGQNMNGFMDHLLRIQGKADSDSIFSKEEKEKIREENPAWAREFIGLGFYNIGLYDSAIHYLEGSRAESWDDALSVSLIAVGREEEARQHLHEAIASHKSTKLINPINFELARAYALLGNRDSTMYYLELALLDARWGMLEYMKNYPHFKTFYNDPKYRELVRETAEKIEGMRTEIRVLEETGEIPAGVEELNLPCYSG